MIVVRKGNGKIFFSFQVNTIQDFATIFLLYFELISDLILTLAREQLGMVSKSCFEYKQLFEDAWEFFD